MADLAKVKRNIQKMIDQKATEQEIDQYVLEAGTTAEELRGGGSTARPTETPVAKDEPPVGPEKTWTGAALDSVTNTPKQLNEMIVQPLLHLPSTIEGVGKLADAASEKIPGMKELNDYFREHTGAPPRNPEEDARYDKAVNDIGNHYADYIRDPKKNLAEGLPGVISDALMLSPFGMAAKGAKAGSAARAASLVERIAKKHPGAQEALDAMPETGIVADVLGKDGRDLVKTTTKHSPEAADIMTEATLPRSLTSEKVLQGKIDAIRDAHRGARHDAYEKAYKEGGEIPYTRTNKGDAVPGPFVNLLSDGVARDAYMDAVPAVHDFAKHSGSHGGPLAEIDMTQRLLMERAAAEEVGVSKGTKGASLTTAKRYRDAAQSLKNKADEILGTPAYSDARAIADKQSKLIEDTTAAHELEEAVQKGTQRSIHKGESAKAPEMGKFWSTVATGGILGGAGHILGTGQVIPGLAAMITGMAPVVREAWQSHKFTKMAAEAPEVAKILASKTLPKAEKMTLIERIIANKATAPTAATIRMNQLRGKQ